LSLWVISATTLEDIEEILTIEQDSFDQPWGHLSFGTEIESPDAYLYTLREAGALSSSPVIAYIALKAFVDELHLMRIAVRPQNRRCGIAGLLLREALRRIGQISVSRIILEVRETNTPALCLYKRLGFSIIGRRPHYYPKTGEDALVLSRNLKEEP
jgi:ribosomal-protein-alanine N-acetyltransferase